MSQHDPYETMHVVGGRHVKLWTSGVPVDAAAKEQLANTARMPFVFSHVVPGSMGARSYIVRGLGNAASFESCSHGAGRTMSRTAARFVRSVS